MSISEVITPAVGNTNIRSLTEIKKFKPLAKCVDLYSISPASHIKPISKPRFDVLYLSCNKLSLCHFLLILPHFSVCGRIN